MRLTVDMGGVGAREHNRSHQRVQTRVEHVFDRVKSRKVLHGCRLKGDGVHHTMLNIARLHKPALAG